MRWSAASAQAGALPMGKSVPAQSSLAGNLPCPALACPALPRARGCRGAGLRSSCTSGMSLEIQLAREREWEPGRRGVPAAGKQRPGPASASPRSAEYSHRITGSQHGRGWKGPLWVTQPNPLPKQGHPEQAAQDRVQEGLEYLQRRRLHSLPGQPGPGLRHVHRLWLQP